MLTYFILGLVSGIVLSAVVAFGMLMRYRKEVLSLKRVLHKVESLNAQMGQIWTGSQNQDNEELKNQQRIASA